MLASLNTPTTTRGLPLIPLSEDERVVLDNPREIVLREGEEGQWDEVSTLRRGERRSITVDIRIGPGARGRMVRVFDVPEGASLNVVHRIRVAEDGVWTGIYCVRGRGEIRIRRVLELCGPRAEAYLGCFGQLEDFGYFSGGDEVFSSAPGTKGSVRTKMVLRNSARSEARGRIVLQKEAQQSELYERLDHLLLGDRAQAIGIPELEVHADDVKCGHGATSARPSEAALFYLASRGLEHRTAENVLARGFVEEGLTHVPEGLKTEALRLMFG